MQEQKSRVVKLSQGRMARISGAKGVLIHDPRSFLTSLQLDSSVTIQAVNVQSVAGPEHLQFILEQAEESRRRGILYAQRLEVDILLRIACSLQIKKAFDRVGLKKGKQDLAIMAIGPIARVDSVWNRLKRIIPLNFTTLEVTPVRLKKLMSIHRIDGVSLSTVSRTEAPVPGILAEKAALLQFSSG